MLAQIVVDDERVLPAIAKMLAYRASGVGSDVLERSGLRRGGGYHQGVFHRTVAVQLLHQLRHGGTLLANRDVDALHPLAPLIDDGVERDRRFAGLLVADDQFALPTPDRTGRVNCLDPGLQRLVDALPADDPGCLQLDAARFR